MSRKTTGTIVLLGALALLAPAVSHADNPGPGTLIETRPYETDDNITTAIREDFARDKVLKGSVITIRTRHANVELSGSVSSKAAADRAAAIVQRMPEVDKLHNKLTVRHR